VFSTKSIETVESLRAFLYAQPRLVSSCYAKLNSYQRGDKEPQPDLKRRCSITCSSYIVCRTFCWSLQLPLLMTLTTFVQLPPKTRLSQATADQSAGTQIASLSYQRFLLRTALARVCRGRRALSGCRQQFFRQNDRCSRRQSL
jgi:hypothetical protein